MVKRYSTMAAAAVAVLMLAACGTGGGLGDIFPGQSASNELRGRVDYVDANNGFVVLTNVSGHRTMLSNTGGDTVRVYFDNRTPVEYQGQTYRPTDLERGDEVAVTVDESGNRLIARSMTVLYDSSRGGTTGGYPSGSGAYDTTIRGTVRSVDTSRRTIQIDRGGYGGIATVDFDANTYVTFGGRNYRPQDLQRGDEIEIRGRDIGGGRFIAQDINVIRSVSSGGGTFGSSASTVRGTVQWVDASRREIGLTQTNWISGFQTGTGTGTGSNMVIRYDANTNVEFGGRLYAPTNLERGDIIDVQVQNTGAGSLLADRIVVVRDVNVR